MAEAQKVGQNGSFEETRARIASFPGMVSISSLARVLRTTPSTLKVAARAKGHPPILDRDGLLSIDRDTALALVDRQRPCLDGWMTTEEMAALAGIDRKRLKFLLGQHRVTGAKDISGEWRVPEAEKDRIKEINDAIAEGVIVRDGTKYYSIARASRDAASALAKPDTAEYREHRNRLNKRFQRQVYQLELGQLPFEGKIYVPESIYRRMINPSTLELGGTTGELGGPLLRKLEEPVPPHAAKRPEPTATPTPVSAAQPPPPTPAQQKPAASSAVRPAMPAIEIIQGELPAGAPAQNAPPASREPAAVRGPSGNPRPTYPSVSTPPAPAAPRAQRPAIVYNTPLVYDPEHPPSLEKCPKGREIEFYGNRGVVDRQLLDNPFSPKILVRFTHSVIRDHKEQHLLLAVERDSRT